MHSSMQEGLQYVSNHMEDVMRAKSGWVAGVFAVMVVTGVVSASESVVDVSRVDVIGHLQEAVVQSDSMKA